LRYLLLLFCQLFCLICHAQQLFSLQSGYLNEAQGLLVENDRIHIYGRFQNEDLSRSTTLLRIDTVGDSLMIVPAAAQKGEIMAFNHAIPYGKNNLFLSHRDACVNKDNLNLGNQIYRVDSNQQILWKSPIILYSFTQFKPFESITRLSNDTFILANKNEVLTYDLGDKTPLYREKDLEGFSFVLGRSDSTFTAIRNKQFYVYNTKCEVKLSKPLDYAPVDFSWYGEARNAYLSIGKNKVSTLNYNGSTVISHGWASFKSDFDSLHRIHWLRDSLFLSGYKNGEWRLGQVNRFFEIDTSIVLGPGQYELQDVQWSGSNIYYLLKDSLEHQDVLGKVSFRHFFTNQQPDIGIGSIRVDSLITNPNQNGLFNPEFELSIDLINPSQDTIKSLYINWISGSDTTCSARRFSKRIYKTIAPKTQVTVQLQLSDTLLEPESKYPLCLSVSSPNGLIDTTTLNNYSCDTVLLPKTGIGEYTFKLPEVPSVIKAGNRIPLPENVTFTALYFMDGRTLVSNRNTSQLVAPATCKDGTYVAAFSYKGIPFRKVVIVAR